MIRTCLFLFGFLLSGIAALPSSIYTCARKNNSAARPLSRSLAIASGMGSCLGCFCCCWGDYFYYFLFNE